MANWNDRPNTGTVLAAAQHWKQDCLLNDGSLFSSETLWTAENVATLCKACGRCLKALITVSLRRPRRTQAGALNAALCREASRPSCLPCFPKD